jgi:hypothetical protein
MSRPRVVASDDPAYGASGYVAAREARRGRTRGHCVRRHQFVRWGRLVEGDFLDTAALDAVFQTHRGYAVSFRRPHLCRLVRDGWRSYSPPVVPFSEPGKYADQLVQGAQINPTAAPNSSAKRMMDDFGRDH